MQHNDHERESSVQADVTFGEVMKSRPSSAAASKKPKLNPGFTIAAESFVLVILVDLLVADVLGADGIASLGRDSTIVLPNTGGPGVTGFGACATLPISLFTRRLKSPTCQPSIILITMGDERHYSSTMIII